LTAAKAGWDAAITAPSPTTATTPCTAFDVATPTLAQAPLRRPDVSAFFVTTAKSGPGTRMRTTAKMRKDPYAGHHDTRQH
jgi:hypothetical protein